jgi:hypothetical protein
MMTVDGLSFGVLKEQEFQFKSKLTHHHEPRTRRANSISSASTGVNGYSSVTSTATATVIPSHSANMFIKDKLQNQQQQFTYSQTRNVPPSFQISATQLNHQQVNLRQSQPQQLRRPPAQEQPLHNSMSNGVTVLKGVTNSAAKPAEAPSLFPKVPQKSRRATVSSYDVKPIERKSLTTINEDEILNQFQRPRQNHFIQGDPQSDRLAEFVSKMVFYIFWSDCQVSNDFVYYTKYLLETMQVSCSTALLSLYYLNRLRQHLFVPGTFKSVSIQASKYQYRRDPKLEYRLFTISLILANKYLDDNSYSNKAWSEVTGLDLRKVNIMELEFMKYIDYTLLVKEKEYVQWVRWLESFIRIVMDVSASSTAVKVMR